MNILHFTLGKANPSSSNGINSVINGICKYGNQVDGVNFDVLGWSKKQKEAYSCIQRDGFQVHCFNTYDGIANFIKQKSSEYDLVHLHNSWNFTNDKIVKLLRQVGTPYVISVHAGLCSDRLKNRNFLLKKIYHRFIQSKSFENAAAIQATTYEELLDIRKFTNAPIFVLPNGVDLQRFKDVKPRVVAEGASYSSGLFVGRFAREKNIEGLLEAVSLLPDKYKEVFRLDLVGPVTNALRALAVELGVQDLVVFHGTKFAEECTEIMNRSDFYIHPAFSDACPTAVVGAWANGLPTVITRTSYVSYFFNSGAFKMVEPLAHDISRGIMEMLDDKQSWPLMSENALKLVKELLNWQVISESLIQEYRTCIERVRQD